MIFPQAQNWRTSRLPWSLALKNTVNTGISFDTSSGAIAQAQRFASAGFRGYGPVMSYSGAGMDGLGCGCGCGGHGGCGNGATGGLGGLLCLAAVGAILYALIRRNGGL